MDIDNHYVRNSSPSIRSTDFILNIYQKSLGRKNDIQVAILNFLQADHRKINDNYYKFSYPASFSISFLKYLYVMNYKMDI